MTDTSLADVWPPLAHAIAGTIRRWNVGTDPSHPAPRHGVWARVVETYRSPVDQAIDYAKGRDATGAIVEAAAVVTHAKPMQSPHNYWWSWAVDIGFMTHVGTPVYDESLYAEFAGLMPPGFSWGGHWLEPRTDRPHFEAAGFTWEAAAAGTFDPVLPTQA